MENNKDFQLKEYQPPRKRNKHGRRATIRRSNFFMTFSTNIPMRKLKAEEQEDLKKKFKETMQEFFSTNTMHEMLELTASKEETPDMKNITLNMRFECKPQITVRTELGPKTDCLHCHALLQFVHRGLNVKFNYKKIRQFWNERMGYNIHFDSQPWRNSQANLMDYINKYHSN